MDLGGSVSAVSPKFCNDGSIEMIINIVIIITIVIGPKRSDISSVF